MFYRFALSSAVVGAYLLLRRADLRVTLGNSACCSDWGAVRFHVAAADDRLPVYSERGRHDDPFLYPLLVAAIMALFSKTGFPVSVMVAALYRPSPACGCFQAERMPRSG